MRDVLEYTLMKNVDVAIGNSSTIRNLQRMKTMPRLIISFIAQ